MNSKSIALTLALSLTTFHVAADSISIEPGKWEMNTVINMPMLPQPRVTSTTECMEEDEISPESLMKDMDNPEADCEHNAELIEENTMKWTMDCTEKRGNSKGEWTATSYGDTLKGSGVITMSVQGQEIQMTMDWEGKRVGACD